MTTPRALVGPHFELIECRDLEHAVEVASRHPMAVVATIEVRPVWGGLGA